VSTLSRLLQNNADWSDRIMAHDPMFFERLRRQQAPAYLWIGCSDSRVPANEIVGLPPGELFVHRNVANVVVHTDLNCLAVLQYAIEALRVQHVIVTGHYGCGGVRAVFDGAKLGLIDNWLRHVDAVRQRHSGALSDCRAQAAFDRLCELNVIEQAFHVCQTTVVEAAWERGQQLSVHGLIYGLHDGRLRELGFSAANPSDVASAYAAAIDSVGRECRRQPPTVAS
jgi:carbonic anhydrase